MTKKINFIFIILIFVSIILGVVLQSSSQHWSGQWDLDFWYIYNASLMSSGYEQEWFDHPATTILVFYSFLYKFYSIFDSNFIYQFDQIISSSDPDLILQKLYFVTRIIDSINLTLIIFFLFKILKSFLNKDIYVYVLILVLIISKTFLNNFSILNPEDWAVLFFLISFYFLTKSFKKKKLNYLFFSGTFFTFSFFAKISILFLYIFIIALIPLLFEIYIKETNNKLVQLFKKYFNLLFGIYIITLLIYFFIQIIVFSKLAPFEKNAGLDATIILFINLCYLLFFVVISKLKFEKLKIYFSLFLFFFIGFFGGVIFFIIIDLLSIVNLNPYVLFHLTNPFNEMIRFTSLNGEGSLSTNTLDFIFIIFSDFLFNKILFLILFLIFIFSIIVDFKNKQNFYFLFKLILFCCLLFNILIFNFRFFIEYSISVYVIYLILLSICLKNLPSRIIQYLSLLLFIYIVVIHPFNNLESFKNITSTRSPSINHLCNEGMNTFKTYSKKFDENTYEKICKKNIKIN